MAIGDSLDMAAGIAADLTVRADGSGTVALPAGIDLAAAEFARIGDDLMIVTDDGRILVVEGFFLSEVPPTLAPADGADFSGDLAARLAEVAEAVRVASAVDDAGPVGSVVNLVGDATVLRPDGARVALRAGDPLFSGDVLETGEGSGLGLLLADETAVSMAGNSRFVLDEVVFDPGGDGGVLRLSAALGVFVLSGGLTAAGGRETMAVELAGGRVVLADARLGIETTGSEFARVVLMRHLDGTVGAARVVNASGEALLEDPGDYSVILGDGAAPTPRLPLDDDVFADIFTDAVEALPRQVVEPIRSRPGASDSDTLFDHDLGDLDDAERFAGFRTDAGATAEAAAGDAAVRVVDGDYTVAMAGPDPVSPGAEAEVASLDAILDAGDDAGGRAGADVSAVSTADAENAFIAAAPDDAFGLEVDDVFAAGIEDDAGFETEAADEPDTGPGPDDAAADESGFATEAAPVQGALEAILAAGARAAAAGSAGDGGEDAVEAAAEADVPDAPGLSLAVGLPADAAAAGDTPIHYYDFETDEDGRVVDRTGDADGLVLDDAGHRPHTVDGAFGRAMQFDGRDDVVAIPHAPDMALDAGAATLWFRAADVVARQGLLSKGAAGAGDGGDFAMLVEDGVVKARLGGVDGDVWVSGGELVENTWHQATVTWGDGKLDLYVDGRLYDSVACTGGLAGNESPWVVAAEDGDGAGGVGLDHFFRGRIDDFALFETALDADRVQALYLEGVAALIDADAPGGVVYPLTIALDLPDDDGIGCVITVAGVPEGAALSAGSDDGGGMWTLGRSDLEGLTLTVPAARETDVVLDVAAFVLDADGARSAATEATVRVALETPPVLAGDGEIAVEAGGEAVIAPEDLRLIDSGDGAAALTYTLTDDVRLGSLYLAGADGRRIDLALGDTFTQADIEAGSLIYEQDIPLGGAVWDPSTPAWGNNAAPVLQSNLTVPLQAECVTLTFRGESAGFNNALGWYRLDADGRPTDPRIVWAATDSRELDEGATVALDGLAPGEGFGLFIIRDGANRFGWLKHAAEGPMRFGEDGGLEFLDADGGRVRHGIDREDLFFTDSRFNPDRIDHAVSGTAEDGLMIGFEDLPGGGDGDYNDVFVSVRYDGVGRANLDATDVFTFTAEDSSGAAMVAAADAEPGAGYTVNDGAASFAIHIEDIQ